MTFKCYSTPHGIERTVSFELRNSGKKFYRIHVRIYLGVFFEKSLCSGNARSSTDIYWKIIFINFNRFDRVTANSFFFPGFP